jgi:hypothetical protein
VSKEESPLDILKRFARTLPHLDNGTHPREDAIEAAAAVLVSMSSHALAGTEHVPHPDHSSVEKCSVAACFLAACSVPLLSWIKEEGSEPDPYSLMHRVGEKVFASFGEEDRKTIIGSGIGLFREMAQAAKENRRMEEWLTSVHDVTERFVLTEGRSDCIELIAPLYLVLLMATGQAKA